MWNRPQLNPTNHDVAYSQGHCYAWLRNFSIAAIIHDSSTFNSLLEREVESSICHCGPHSASSGCKASSARVHTCGPGDNGNIRRAMESNLIGVFEGIWSLADMASKHAVAMPTQWYVWSFTT